MFFLLHKVETEGVFSCVGWLSLLGICSAFLEMCALELDVHVYQIAKIN